MPIIQFINVNKWFGSNHVLRDVNFTVDEGEVVVICGPSGSGKSTMIRTINQLEPIDSGELIVDGVQLSDGRIKYDLLKRVGMVFQQFKSSSFVRLWSPTNAKSRRAPALRCLSCSLRRLCISFSPS